MSDEEFDDFGNLIGKEYSEDEKDWEDASDEFDQSSEGENGDNIDYGEEVEFAHYSEDDQDMAVPNSAPKQQQEQTRVPQVIYSRQFRQDLAENPKRVRSIAVVGHFDHGKTSLIDILVGKNYAEPVNHFTDFHDLERKRQMTLKLGPVSLLLPNIDGTSFVMNIVDTPGHRDFSAEVECGLHLADGAIVVVDVVEGLLPMARAAIKMAKNLSKPMIFLLNKIDRLHLDLHLTPQRAFERIWVVIEEVNNYLLQIGAECINPCDANVFFASTRFNFVFNIQEAARLYRDYQCPGLDSGMFAKYLWGDISLIEGKFVPRENHTESLFAEYILGPIFKLISLGMVLKTSDLQRKLNQELGIRIGRRELEKPLIPRLISIFSLFFLNCWENFVSVITETVPEPELAEDNTPVASLQTNDGIHTLIRVNQPLLCAPGLRIPQSQYTEPVESVPLGSWALMKSYVDLVPRFSQPMISASIETKNPADKQRMEERISILTRLYRQLHANVEQTGEHTLWGPGELYLDCVMYELRNLCDEFLEVDVSDLTVGFRETVIETSYVACPTYTPDRMNSITLLVSPLNIPAENIKKYTTGVLKDAGWDALALKSLIAIVGDKNTFVDETIDLPSEKRVALGTHLEDLRRGVEWAVNEGPLCESPTSNVSFRIMEVSLDDSLENRNGIQLVQMARRACYAAMMLASPRLLEPWFHLTVIGPVRTGRNVYRSLTKRRGYVTRDEGLHLTKFYVTEGRLPVIDSFGLETEIRLASEGQAHVVLEPLERWELVPGNPLDEGQKTGRLEKSEDQAIARDFMLKTRNRKGLSAKPQPKSYFDDEFAELIGN